VYSVEVIRNPNHNALASADVLGWVGLRLALTATQFFLNLKTSDLPAKRLDVLSHAISMHLPPNLLLYVFVSNFLVPSFPAKALSFLSYTADLSSSSSLLGSTVFACNIDLSPKITKHETTALLLTFSSVTEATDITHGERCPMSARLAAVTPRGWMVPYGSIRLTSTSMG
jgi:hypothetical protein